MSKAGGVSRQWSDLLAYVLLPVLSLLTPASFSRQVLGRMSAWKSVLQIDAALALEGARKHLDISDGAAWQQRWKQVELLEDKPELRLLVNKVRRCAFGGKDFPLAWR